MIKRAPIRSSLFNITFILYSVIACLVFLPSLLGPRRLLMGVIHIYLSGIYVLELLILGLNYRVLGRQNLPQDGSYIVAAKHQSPYETFKLHLLLKDPGIVLKQELLNIPLWGQYLKKSGGIAIDRSKGSQAAEKIAAAADNVIQEGRPIVIFPQGTRVNPDETVKDKPYKSGVYRLQEATNLPIVPMALNAGLFWPRKGWLKSSGAVTFQFLPPIPPGLPREETQKRLEQSLEDTTQNLMQDALNKQSKPQALWLQALAFLIFFALFSGAYTFYWHWVADQVKGEYTRFVEDLGQAYSVSGETRTSNDYIEMDIGFVENADNAPLVNNQPVISGFPGKIQLFVARQEIDTPFYSLQAKNIQAEGWPLPGWPVLISFGAIEFQTSAWPSPIRMDSFAANVTFNNQQLKIHEASLLKDDFHALLTGTLDLKQEPIPRMDLQLQFQNVQDFLRDLVTLRILDQKLLTFTSVVFQTLKDEEGKVRIPIYQREDVLYFGPLAVLRIENGKPISLRR